jgi:EAL domain-containing protein (putative c-di-GMP-specific phosphodiesterase class I)
VRDILACREAVEIVRAIVSLARSLNLQVIAEGVETRAQLDALHGLGCEQYQGCEQRSWEWRAGSADGDSG